MNTVEQELKRRWEDLAARKSTMTTMEYLAAHLELLKQQAEYLASLNFHTRYDGRSE